MILANTGYDAAQHGGSHVAYFETCDQAEESARNRADDWENSIMTYTFDDNSALVVNNGSITAVEPEMNIKPQPTITLNDGTHVFVDADIPVLELCVGMSDGTPVNAITKYVHRSIAHQRSAEINRSAGVYLKCLRAGVYELMMPDDGSAA